MPANDQELPVQRFSSRTHHLGRDYLSNRLQSAAKYDRISGYFTSSLFTILAEPLSNVGKIQMICNSDLNPRDVEIAKNARDHESVSNAQLLEWRATAPEQRVQQDPEIQRGMVTLYELLKSKQLEVRVLPNEVFGLVHGKAGVITKTDGSTLAFMGSVNDTAAAWAGNYELLWEDATEEGVAWTQSEFDALWNHPLALPLADAVIEDVERLSKRIEIPLEDWQEKIGKNLKDLIASPLIEAPIYQQDQGIWEHQKSFIQQVMLAHNKGHARFLLADQVGLGKTLQLATSAMLIALQEEQPVLIVTPKSLLPQWQEEMWAMLRLPSCMWDNNAKAWITERGERFKGVRNMPRRIMLVSHQWLAWAYNNERAKTPLFTQKWSLLIVDEAHKARRTNPNAPKNPASRNQVLECLHAIAPNTKSMLLATATPIQLHPIEAFDLMELLSVNAPEVLGTETSRWRNREHRITGLDIAMQRAKIEGDHDQWEWLRNPFPLPYDEWGTPQSDFQNMRRSMQLRNVDATPEMLNKLNPIERSNLKRFGKRWLQEKNPYLRHIVMRTRAKLEEEGKLKPIPVELYGDCDGEAIPVSGSIQEAFFLAEEITRLLRERDERSTRFLQMHFLQRICSSYAAGRITSENILNNRGIDIQETSSNDDESEEWSDETAQEFINQLPELETKLWKLVGHLQAYEGEDPKVTLIKDLLSGKHQAGTGNWLDDGCIIFSQYLDTARHVAEALSEAYPDERIGLYTNELSSGYYEAGAFTPYPRDQLKKDIKARSLRLLVGTDAAAEGLNLQYLSNLINVDLPWNPTRLEQRKGRIQRSGQRRSSIRIYNMRYAGSVEERVRERLSQRLNNISAFFGYLPEIIEDLWVATAREERAEIEKLIEKLTSSQIRETLHPFARSERKVPDLRSWEKCTQVLKTADIQRWLSHRDS